MKTLTTIAFVIAFAVAAFAQDRQVELNANIPAKRGLLSQDIQIGGRVYLPVGDHVVTVADLNFQDAANLFLNPTDQIQVNGQMWLYLSGAPAADGKTHIRPFVFGGIAQSFFTNAPNTVNATPTQGVSGFGINVSKPSGFQFIPTFEFNTDDIQAGTVLGKEYAAKFHFFVPLSPSFNLNLAPYISRVEGGLASNYTTRYGIKVGFARKF